MTKQGRILLLASASGFVGVSYEFLLSRVLSIYFGDIFFVGPSIFCSFMLGLAFGAGFYRKVGFSISKIETWIGLYIGIFAVFHLNYSLQISSWIRTTFGLNPFFTVFAIVALVLPLAFLCGMALPAFDQACDKESHGDQTFSKLYLYYNG